MAADIGDDGTEQVRWFESGVGLERSGETLFAEFVVR